MLMQPSKSPSPAWMDCTTALGCRFPWFPLKLSLRSEWVDGITTLNPIKAPQNDNSRRRNASKALRPKQVGCEFFFVFFSPLCHLDGEQHYYCDLNYPDGIGCMANNGRETKKAINTCRRSLARRVELGSLHKPADRPLPALWRLPSAVRLTLPHK